jgi:hypothetical protein
VPERQNRANDGLVVLSHLAIVHGFVIAIGEKLGDLDFAVENALAPDFRRMRGQDRRD